MADIVNLRMARKAKARDADKAQAQANRALHGRTREERKASDAEIARIARNVDGAKRED
ncbi:hypothetical protein GCM10011349_00590 [Novosphingobium indicum]|jgi:hypothetical protein|uniref:DUF4169 domain-containing protein n=1 Tax=Novosphingobium indicum TaxID=462949 RepID=A0ABQ2J823_9SPHN|nr:DUF4169 family protein [Novosphingobium indicum]GGN40023.1 hypothetical protein GCM10011349_00590 [Novosphingobium indicum]|tara:strand:+ start:197 stop:373 length:177 start_codon:yes stop_codon:yes gene_type:complete